MKKYYWHAFRHEKLFEKQPQLHSQTPSSCQTIFFLQHIITGVLKKNNQNLGESAADCGLICPTCDPDL